MKLSLVFFLCLLIKSAYCEITTKEPKLLKDASSFLYYEDDMIVLPLSLKSIDVAPSHESQLFKVSVSKLKKFGLIEGSLIRSVDIIEGKANRDFILKDFVYGIQAPGGATDSEKEINQLRVILSYDEKIIEKIKKKDYFYNVSTGVAYIGKGRELFVTKVKNIPANVVSYPNFEYSRWDHEKKSVIVRSIKLFDNILYYFANTTNATNSTLLKTSSGYYDLNVNTDIMTPDLKFFKISDWGRDQKLWIRTNSLGPEHCSDLVFISRDSVEMVPLPCNERD